MVLDSEFYLSGSDPRTKDLVAQFIDEANHSILVKGVSEDRLKEASQITQWSIRGNSLLLTIESGRLVRATSALLRLRKALAPRLGKELRIGVRDIEIPNLQVFLPLKPKSIGERIGRLESIPKISSVKRTRGGLLISFEKLTERELQTGTPERTIRLLEKIATEVRLAEDHVPAETPVVRQGEKKPIRFGEDPIHGAVRKGWVKEFPGRGQWIYTPPYVKLLEVLENLLLDEIVEKLGFQPFMVPKLIPLEVMKMMPGYFDSIPEGMYYVCPPPRDPSAFEKFKDLFRISNEVPREELDRVVKKPNYVLDPSQCTPLWYFLSHETIDLSLLPFKFYDRSGWTYRWEGGGVEGLVRVQEFRRVELVYVASPDDTVKIRDSILEESIRVADEILDMEWRVAAASPFFVREEETSGFETGESRDVAAFDLEVYIPYRGPRESSEWLEVTSCFVHKKKFIDSFRIREVKGREIWCGCSGLGVSRWVAAFLSTHGFDSTSWPKRVNSEYGESTLPPRTLEWPTER